MKRLLLLLLVLLLAGVTTGCDEPTQGVVVWHPLSGREELALKKLAAKWEAETHTKVTVLAVPYEAYLSKLEAAIPRGNGPDIFIGPHNRLGEYRLHHLVAPVGDAFPDADIELYEPVTVEAITHEGHRFAVPLASKAVALYYNTRLIDEAPKALEDLKPRTDGIWPLAYETHSTYYHAALLHAYGGKLFDNGFAMVGPEAEKSVLMARQLVSTRVVPPESSGDLVKTLFVSGKAAAVLSGPWLAGDLPDGVPYAVVPLPTIEGKPMRPFLTVDGAFMTPNGALKADARAFVRSLASDASAKERAETGRQIVATKSYWSNGNPDALLRAFRDASANAIPMPTATTVNPVWEPASQAIRKVLRGDASAHDALNEAKARYDDVMRAPSASPSPAPLVIVLGIALLAAAIAIVRRVRAPGFKRELQLSKPAYKYVIHAALTILVLVVLPLLAGAATSFFTGTREEARFVGLSNYIEILTARGKPLLSHGSFYLTLLVTVLWTILNVIFHVGIGLVLGIALARPMLKMRAVYRVLLILPWAVPSYVTALAWKGMFHSQYGAINAILTSLGAQPVAWFSKFSTAFAANLATNIWLGFPFMMVVVMGALTSISKDVLEAAEVDGATRWQAFRLVTLPLLRPTLLPAVVLGAVWTFNMFNVVYLVSGGEPDGTTDILVSEAYRWAFARNAQLGYAAAYAVIIFGLLVVMSRGLERLGGPKEAT